MLDGYAARLSGGRDEMMAPDGTVRAHYRPLIEALAGLTTHEREARFHSARQYLSEAGVFHRVYGEGHAPEEERDWPLALPPLVIDPDEWAELGAGLVQRAEFLEALLGDLYGRREVVRSGALPSALLGQNPEFLRPLSEQGLSGAPMIRFVAFDLGRGPDGRWWVLGDRAQAPSGAGFALENRVATSKAFPDLSREMNVARLAGFFQAFRETLYGLAEPGAPRIGLLTPGPLNDTYYEHFYLARYLGLLLLEGGDLVIREDRAHVRTVDGTQPISVLWRRLDADFVDPLELFSGSRIGTPGLLRAVRAGHLHLVNALGSGILETPAFLAFQPALAKALLGADLTLPTIATWWCGQEKERAYVCAHAGRLTLSPAFPPASGVTPAPLPRPANGKLALAPEAGLHLIGQEIASLSTVPVFVDGRLEPRPVALRVFLARGEDGWQVMPGGFARVADAREARAVSMHAGGRSIDVWVPSQETTRPVTLLRPAKAGGQARLPGALPARAADNLFWLGRYAERCEVATRLLRLCGARTTQGLRAGELEERVRRLLLDLGIDAAGPAPARGLLTLARQALETASRIRDRFSPDGWRALSEIVDLLVDGLKPDSEVDLVDLTSAVLTRLSGFTGLVRENMYQFTGWRLMKCGRRMERGRMSAIVASALLEDEPEGALEALLEFTDSRVTYRRRFSVDLSSEAVIDLCILDPMNPRSVAFQVNSLCSTLAKLPGVREGEKLDMLSRRAARLQVRVATAEPQEVTTGFLDRIAGDFGLLSTLLTERYLLADPASVQAGAHFE
ncbi:hypothetical protein ASG48_07885 [Aurantimonas sp. Leaf443]|nr:hypothetical protein ASG48_07885 [Aurantimonas sp. Leaf443]